MLNFITLVGICLLAIILIVCLINKANTNNRKENFVVFHPDNNIRKKINLVNENKRAINRERNISNNNLNKTRTINEIETKLSNYDIILSSIMENINDIPICREIDLFPNNAPGQDGVVGTTCEEKNKDVCELNPYCELLKNNSIQTCKPKTLNSECANIMTPQPTTAINPNVNFKPNRFFLYPNLLKKASSLL